MDENGPANALEHRRKRLIYRSQHRGTKELDLLIGSFARQHLPDMTAEQLDRYETLLEVPEPLLYAWMLGQEAPADDQRNDVVELLLNFRFSPPRL